METLPEFAERTVSEVTPVFDERERARGLIADIAGHCWHGRGDMVDRVHDALRRHYRTWTRRRIRAFWHREAASVRWNEMRQLEFVAEVERAKRQEQEQSRSAHNEFVTRIGATLDRLAASDAAFHREHMLALRGVAGGQAHPAFRDPSSEGTTHPAQCGEGDRS